MSGETHSEKAHDGAKNAGWFDLHDCIIWRGRLFAVLGAEADHQELVPLETLVDRLDWSDKSE